MSLDAFFEVQKARIGKVDRISADTVDATRWDRQAMRTTLGEMRRSSHIEYEYFRQRMIYDDHR